jgi:sulfur-carrier protein adenylyltransferase/sulfurtransferase
MSKKYFIPIFLLVGLGLVLVLLPAKKSYKEVQPEELLRQISSQSRFISPDIVADRLIKKDPSLQLVDVRNAEQFLEFTLPGAVNIPLQDIFLPEKQELFTLKGMNYVFFSNGDILSDQAWILCTRKGLKNIFVMKGGLNEWFNSFFLLQPPPETSSSEEIELYQFRNGVKQFFTGGETEVLPKQETETISITPKAKKSAAEGGC